VHFLLILRFTELTRGKTLIIFFGCIEVYCVTGVTERKFSYATYFESNMVLQMAPVRSSVWGFAPASAVGETVVVRLASNASTRVYTADVVPGKSCFLYDIQCIRNFQAALICKMDVLHADSLLSLIGYVVLRLY